MNLRIVLLSILVLQLSVMSASGFSFLNEFFADLKFGSLENEFMNKKLNVGQIKCLQGSYSFNGSCYFISNKKYIDVSEKDIIVEYLMKIYKKKETGPGSMHGTPLGLAAEIAAAPEETSWNDSASVCKQLNNDSTLFYYNNNQAEFDFVIDLLKRLNFPNLILSGGENAAAAAERNGLSRNYIQEKKYYIGLSYNSKIFILGEGVLIDYILNQINCSRSTMGVNKWSECEQRVHFKVRAGLPERRSVQAMRLLESQRQWR
jgi:hypothetical protein